MTQDEIIEMAMEAEFVSHGKPSEEESELFVCVDKDIVRFAHLVAQKVRDRIMFGSRDDWVLAEREACAKLCDAKVNAEYATGKVDHNEMGWTQSCAIAIRARGEQA